MWTRFMDMHSGGGVKEPPYEHIYIEADEDVAKIVFFNRFGHNPERVSCTCCGDDYSVSSHESLEYLTGYDRNCKYDSTKKTYLEQQSDDLRKYVLDAEDDNAWKAYLNKRGHAAKYHSLDEYCRRPDVLIIPAKDIKDSERHGNVPRQGFVWMN